MPAIPDEVEFSVHPHYLINCMSMNLIRTCAAVSALLLSGALSAQTLTLMDFNVRSFEETTTTGQLLVDDISDYIEFFRDENPDIITLNEFENYTGRMGRDRMSEIAAALGMYAYYIKFYPKDAGYYGNCILSKYPIISAASERLPYKHYLGEGNYQWNSSEYTSTWGADQRSVGYVDILVPVSATENTIVRVVCTHMDHEIGSAGHRIQFETVSEFASLADPVYPTLLAGDLNVTYADYVSVFSDVGDWIHNGGLDHIFGFPQSGWTVVSHEDVRSGSLSDHNAVKAVVTLNK